MANANAEMLREHSNQRAFVQISSAVLLAALVLVAVRGVAMPGADLLVLLVVFGRLVPRLSTLHSGSLSLVSLLPSFAAATRLLQDCEANSEAPTGTARAVAFSRALVLEDVTFTYPASEVPASVRGHPASGGGHDHRPGGAIRRREDHHRGSRPRVAGAAVGPR